MDNRTLERITIIILLLLDVVLLGTVLSDRAENGRSERETAEQVTALLADSGITAEPDAVSIRPAPPRLKLLRSMEREEELVSSLLGSATQEDLGGNIYFYRSETGQLVFRGSGEVAALFSSGAVPIRGNPEKTVRRYMRRLGADCTVTASGEDESGAPFVEVRFLQDGFPVFNGTLHFDFSDTGLYMISGTRLFDTRVQEPQTELMNSASALMRFAEIAEREGIICSRLTECTPGYLQSVVVSGESTLTPVWQIVTDTGSFLINAETGKLENASA